MSDNYECSSKDFGAQLTNCILDSGSIFHMTPLVSDFITGWLEDTDKYIEVADRHRMKAKQK